MVLPFGNEYFKIGKVQLVYCIYCVSDILLEFCAVNVKKWN